MLRKLLLLLFATPAAFGAVTEEGTAVGDIQLEATNWSSIDVGFTVTSSCELLLASMNVGANDDPVNVPVWDVETANESFTLIDQTTPLVEGGNHTHYTWGLINPTDKAANVNFTPGTGTISWSTATIQCFKGVDNASVAAATNFIDECVGNDGLDSDCDISSGGTSGNLMYGSVGFRGSDQDPITATGWTEVIEVAPSAGSAAPVVYTAWKASATALNWTGSQNDEFAGHMIDLVAASQSIMPLVYEYLQ